MKWRRKKREKKNESLIAGVYAGPQQMKIFSSPLRDADIEEVYAGPEEMEKTFVDDTVTTKVYAGPEILRDEDREFNAVYAGPPMEDEDIPHIVNDKDVNLMRPYPANYADTPEEDESAAKTLICPVCGMANKITAKFCVECGSLFTKNPPTANV